MAGDRNDGPGGEDSSEFVLRSREMLQRSRDLLLSSHALLMRLREEDAARRAAPLPPEPPPGPG